MTIEELDNLEKILMEEVVKRRKLGGYSMEAAGLLLLAESNLAIVQHLRTQTSKKK